MRDGSFFLGINAYQAVTYRPNSDLYTRERQALTCGLRVVFAQAGGARALVSGIVCRDPSWDLGLTLDFCFKFVTPALALVFAGRGFAQPRSRINGGEKHQ